MTIIELRKLHISPFEIDDTKLKQLFSFFLHLSLTIDSQSSIETLDQSMTHRWNSFLDHWGDNPLKIYSENSDFPNTNVLAENNLGDASEVKRNSSAIICKRKTKESDAACVLRHIQNAIAHAHMSVCYC